MRSIELKLCTNLHKEQKEPNSFPVQKIIIFTDLFTSYVGKKLVQKSTVLVQIKSNVLKFIYFGRGNAISNCAKIGKQISNNCYSTYPFYVPIHCPI